MLLDSATYNTIFSITEQINFNSEVSDNNTEKIAFNLAITEEVQEQTSSIPYDISPFIQEPIPIDDLSSLLSSEFELAPLGLSASISSADPYSQLINKLYSNWISAGKFVFITYDSIELRFQNVSNFNTYGAMMIGWYPDPSLLVPDMLNPNDVDQTSALSQCHPQVLSFATTDSGKMSIPWIHPANKMYLHNPEVTTAYYSQFRLWYKTLCGPTPITSTGSVGTYVRMWGKIVNPKLIFRSQFFNTPPILPVVGPQLEEDTDEFEVIAQSGS
jgi:hypothetical protein